ncbi:MAG: hypothetical protein ABIG35_17375 [Pseudomonadota bacterium]
MSDELAAAYKLLRAFKTGQFQAEASVSEKQQLLVRLLSEDLEVPAGDQIFQQQILLVAEADSKWNNQTQMCVSKYYALCEQGLAPEANAIRTQFLSVCPSSWYRGIVEAL